MRKFASLTLHKERRERAGATPRDPLSPTLSHGPSVSVQPATVIYHRSNLPGNSSHSAERSNEFVARWIVRLLASPWPRSDRIEEISSRTPEFRICLQFDFNATRVNFLCHVLSFVWSFALSLGKWLNIEENLVFFGKHEEIQNDFNIFINKWFISPYFSIISSRVSARRQIFTESVRILSYSCARPEESLKEASDEPSLFPGIVTVSSLILLSSRITSPNKNTCGKRRERGRGGTCLDGRNLIRIFRPIKQQGSR